MNSRRNPLFLFHEIGILFNMETISSLVKNDPYEVGLPCGAVKPGQVGAEASE
jgi:hypothetical protein